MGPFVIVGPHPLGCIVLYLANRLKQVVAEPVVTYRAVIAFNIGILLRDCQAEYSPVE